MKRTRLRIGLIGTGDFAPFFAPYIQEVANLVAVCDPSAESRAHFASKTGLDLPGFDHHEELFAEMDIDAVAVLSPNFTHKEITVAAARAGKHVFCEKAMANSVPECWDMVRACETAGVRLMVGQKRRLRPPWARMIELREKLGTVTAITACAYHDARPYDFQGWWTRQDQSGGTLSLIGVHMIDWMRAMCGEVASVSAQAAPQVDSRYDFPDTMHVTLRFHSGAIATLTVSLIFPPWQFRESSGPIVICERGGMRFVPSPQHLDLYWQHHDDTGPRHERFDDLGFDHAYRREFGDFVGWITEGTEPCLTWSEGLRCVEVMEAARCSADRNGAEHPLPLYPELETTYR